MLTVLQRHFYYPFGMRFDGIEPVNTTNENLYQYNGKELTKDFGIDWYNFGARWYDAAVGRFAGVDPLAEKYSFQSPFAYATNNPVLLRDILGMGVYDIIDIDKNTGGITATKAAGNDLVRLLDGGKVVDSYSYGENGSFTVDNQIILGDFDGVQGIALVTINGDKAQSLYEFAAKSDVEFGKLDAKKPNGNTVSIITTSHDPKVVATLPSLVKELSNRGFTGLKQSHSHPAIFSDINTSIPSGYYDYKKDNPFSLMPDLTTYGKPYGDALNAIQVKSLKGFGNTIFEVYAPGKNTKTIYDGVHRAKIHKN